MSEITLKFILIEEKMSKIKYGVKTIAKIAFYPDLAAGVNTDIEKDFGPCLFLKKGKLLSYRA